MPSKRAALLLGSLLWLSFSTPAAADDALNAAYAAILRGDYDSGRASIAQLNSPGEDARQAESWLESFRARSSDRDQLRENTFSWNVEKAKAALAENKVFLALSFAAQASEYAKNESEFADEVWVGELRQRAVAEADLEMKAEHWTRALSFYHQLLRIFEDDTQLDGMRDQASKRARLEFLYAKDEDVKRRLKDVSYDLFENAVRMIDDSYYERPNFKEMAAGALDNLVALCNTTKLYDASSVFDGIANPSAREHFLSKLEQARRKVNEEDDFDAKDLLRLFRDVRKSCRESVSLPDELLIVEFSEGALEKLDDFTSIVWPADAVEFDKMMIGNFFGVGIQLGVDELTSRLKVVTPLENSPALRAGVQPDDLIIEVNGVDTSDWTTDKAVREITGMEGTDVTLTMFRPRTGQKLPFTLKRSEINLTTIRGVDRADKTGNAWNFMLDPAAGVAYIQLTGFNPDSQSELTEALKAAKSQGMRGLILDLRNNPGGLLDVAVSTVSTFLKDGTVVWTKGRREARQELEVSGEPSFGDLPLVVMVNEGSASASEILSGALKDHGRAVVLGERTFGKGSVQRVLRLDRSLLNPNTPPAARLKLTTALYYLPSNRSPHRQAGAKEWGVDPTWNVRLTPKEFGKLMEKQREAYIIHNEETVETPADEAKRQEALASLKVADAAKEEDADEPLLSEADIKELRADPYEAPKTDPQLETALLHLRVKLAGGLPWPDRIASNTKDQNSAASP